MKALVDGKPIPCWKHGRCCALPKEQEDLFVMGFCCKKFSRQNCNRYQAWS